MTLPTIHDLDFSKLTLLPSDDRVALKLDEKAVWFNLCRTRSVPVKTRYPLDAAWEGGSRRGLTVALQADQTELLRRLDAFVCEKVAASAKQIFGQPLTLAQVRARYEPLLKEKDGEALLKFKVKCERVPTKLYFADESPAPLSLLEDGRAEVVPILSLPLLWFMDERSRFGLCCQAEGMIVAPAERLFDAFSK